MLLLLYLLVMSSALLVAMDEIIPVETARVIVMTPILAKATAQLLPEDRQNYTLTPTLIAKIIKQKILNDRTEVSNSEIKILEEIQQQPQQYALLENEIYALLNSGQLHSAKKTSALQKVRAQLFKQDQCVFTNAYEKWEKTSQEMEIYQTYEADDLPLGWCTLWLLECVVAGIMAIVAIHAC